MRNRTLAYGLGAVVATVNMVFLHFIMNTGATGRQLIPGLLDFSPAWNRGVSFGLFSQDTETGRHMLILVLSVIAVGVLILAWQARSRIAAIAFGFILGGALGNLIDRILHSGVVFDFLAVHLGRLPLFVCNLPDIAITVGAVLLAVDELLAKPRYSSARSQP